MRTQQTFKVWYTSSYMHVYMFGKKRKQSFTDLLPVNKTKISISWYQEMDAMLFFLNFVYSFFQQLNTFSFTGDIDWTDIFLFYFLYCEIVCLVHLSIFSMLLSLNIAVTTKDWEENKKNYLITVFLWDVIISMTSVLKEKKSNRNCFDSYSLDDYQLSISGPHKKHVKRLWQNRSAKRT